MRNTGTRARILQRLSSGEWVRGEELRSHAAPHASPTNIRVQIGQLRAQGHQIESDHVGRGSRGYRLHAGN